MLFYPCALRSSHRYLTGILQTWWLKNFQHVTHLGHPHTILLSYVCCLPSCLPNMGHMGWSGTHMIQYISPDSCTTVVRCNVDHTKTFVFEHIWAVLLCWSRWHNFGISWLISTPWAQLVLLTSILLNTHLFLCEYRTPECQIWPHPDLHVHLLLRLWTLTLWQL